MNRHARLSRRPLLLLIAGIGALSPGVLAEPPQFWEEIPRCPSTAPPSEIKDGYWHGQFERVNREVAAADRPELVFFGDSITWHWSLGAATGKEVWNQRYAKFRALNMGNSGDITPVMLYRVTHGNLAFPAGQAPKIAVLLCGTNNFVVTKSAGGAVKWELGEDCPPEEVAAGVRAIAQVFRRRLPATRVLMLGILPVANEVKWAKCRKVNALNADYRTNREEVVFLDLEDRFLQADGPLNGSLFTDGTHLTTEGYQVWADSIEPVLSEMMEAPPLDPVKIMLVGDGVTEGRDSGSSFRRYLDGLLRRKGHLIDFVGSRDKHQGNRLAPDSYEFDPDHEGHSGRDSAWLAKHLPELLEGSRPDIVVLHLGTEEIATATDAAGPLADSILQNIGTMIGSLRADNPAARIVVSQLTPVPGREEAVALLNRRIAGLASSGDTGRSRLLVAAPPADFEPDSDLADGSALPNPSGARKVATTIAEALDRLLDHRGR